MSPHNSEPSPGAPDVADDSLRTRSRRLADRRDVGSRCPYAATRRTQVFTPSLTGLEGDPRELTDQVTLDTHIQDVLDLMESELSPTNIRLA